MIAEYKFTSRDGYADYRPRPGGWPGVYVNRKFKPEYCKIDLPKCFPEGYKEGGNASVSTVMKRVAFQEPACGDCCEYRCAHCSVVDDRC